MWGKVWKYPMSKTPRGLDARTSMSSKVKSEAVDALWQDREALQRGRHQVRRRAHSATPLGDIPRRSMTDGQGCRVHTRVLTLEVIVHRVCAIADALKSENQKEKKTLQNVG